MIRRLLMAAAGLGGVLLACNATPDIPNDLPSKGGTAPQRGTRSDTNATDGDDELTGSSSSGRTPSPSKTNSADAGAIPEEDAGGGATPTTDAGTTTTPAPGPCAGSTTQTQCFACCDQQVPDGPAKLNQFFDLCVCQADKCGGYCAQSWCAGFFPAQGDACDQCLNAFGGACDNKAISDCQADPTCSQLLACDQASGCAGKPQ